MRFLCPLFVLAASGSVFAAAVTYSSSGATPAAIQATVDQFRADLGTNNGVGGTFAGGRREINWDGVGAAFRDPMPGNFFNANSPRGVAFSTPGDRFVISGDVGTPQFLFGNLVPYNVATEFQTFSAPRLFGIVGSDTMDVSFFQPGTSTAATTNAFGVIFVDADAAQSTLTFFDENDTSLGSFGIGPGASQSLSFLGVRFNAGEKVSRVRIQAGSGSFTNGNCVDCVVMDDFIYGEPVSDATVPEPSSVLLSLAGVAALAATRLRRRC